MSSSRSNRRRFLMMAGGGLAAGGALYAWQRGVRFPPGRLVDAGPARAASTAGVELSASGAAFQEQAGGELRFRAFAPEPVFTARGRGEARIVIENLHPGATL
ncbi:MAG TPA: hypothetical protein VK973_06130, partial [Arenicellales bacterium]|nr:hypothetical protein [Arenicellales bacterium]